MNKCLHQTNALEYKNNSKDFCIPHMIRSIMVASFCLEYSYGHCKVTLSTLWNVFYVLSFYSALYWRLVCTIMSGFHKSGHILYYLTATARGSWTCFHVWYFCKVISIYFVYSSKELDVINFSMIVPVTTTTVKIWRVAQGYLL